MPTTSRRKPLKNSPVQPDAPLESIESVVTIEKDASQINASPAQMHETLPTSIGISSEPQALAMNPVVAEILPAHNHAQRVPFMESVPQVQSSQHAYSQRSFQQNGRQQQRPQQRDMRFHTNASQSLPRPVSPVIDPHPEFVATHEIFIPRDNNMLEYSYNAGYTEAKLARSSLLDHLKKETDDGARSRCWNCNAVRVMHVVWHSDVANFGDIGVAMCEKCNSWSVM